MNENEFILYDRLEVIKQTIEKYGEENFYLSFSGGKDSVVVHHLLDMALPNNQIPRVYMNTGIEYQKVYEFVKSIKDERIQIIKPSKNIRQTLEEKGYPFKSKEHAQWLNIFQKNKDLTREYMKKIDEDKSLLENYDFIHNLPKGVKWTIKYVYGMRERERERETFTSTFRTPNSLKYQFYEDLPFKVSDKCCLEMKEKPLKEWEKQNNRHNAILGLMRDEGGRRVTTNCLTFKSKGMNFSPLAKVTKEWEEWFIKEYNIKLCELYYPPYNFDRTGCVGCPFNVHIGRELATLEKYLPTERKRAEIIWQPVYEEYRRIGYRLKKNEQSKLF